MKRAVFLDLGGTLVLPLLVERLADLRLIDGAAAAVARLSSAGFVCPIVTIQSRIAKGIFSAGDFQGWFERFAIELCVHGADVVGPYVCPHRFADPCPCKKPSALLYEQAAADHDIDLRRSFVIGDSAADVQAAYQFGGRGCLVRTGYAEDEREVERAIPYAAHVAQSLDEAVAWILNQQASVDPSVIRRPTG